MKRRMLRIVVLAVLFLLLALELILRQVGFGDPVTYVDDEKIEYFVTPDKQFSRFGNSVITNRYGMRVELSPEAAAPDRRVYLLGDSVIYGNHFLDQQETIAYRLESLVKGRELKVFPIAASSWGPENILEYVRRFGPFSGEYAVVVQSTHDIFDVSFKSTSKIPYRKNTTSLALSDAFIALLERLEARFFPGVPVRSLSRGEAKVVTSQALEELLAILKEQVNTVILVHHATYTELVGQSDPEFGASHFREMAKTHQVAFWAGHELYARFCDVELMFRDNIHPSAYGAECITQALHQVALFDASLD